jgi:hypothetical protein
MNEYLFVLVMGTLWGYFFNLQKNLFAKILSRLLDNKTENLLVKKNIYRKRLEVAPYELVK